MRFKILYDITQLLVRDHTIIITKSTPLSSQKRQPIVYFHTPSYCVHTCTTSIGDPYAHLLFTNSWAAILYTTLIFLNIFRTHGNDTFLVKCQPWCHVYSCDWNVLPIESDYNWSGSTVIRFLKLLSGYGRLEKSEPWQSTIYGNFSPNLGFLPANG